MTPLTESQKGDSFVYPRVARLFHWGIFILMAILFVNAWSMPHVKKGQTPNDYVLFHMALGIVFLALVFLRVVVTVFRNEEIARPRLPGLDEYAARAMHYTLLVLLFAIPLSGWVGASARGWHITFFGLFSVPPIAEVGATLARSIGRSHGTIATVFLGFLFVHVAASLYHHYKIKDNVLRSMLPWVK
jgi:cytochrome b561